MIGSFYSAVTPAATGGQPMQVLALRKRGYSEYEIRLIAGGNYLRVMDTVQHLGE